MRPKIMLAALVLKINLSNKQMRSFVAGKLKAGEDIASVESDSAYLMNSVKHRFWNLAQIVYARTKVESSEIPLGILRLATYQIRLSKIALSCVI